MSTPELIFQTDAPLTGHNTTWHLTFEGRPIDVKLERGDQPVSITALDTGRTFKTTSQRGAAIVALVLEAYAAQFGDDLDTEEDHPEEAAPRLTPAGEAVSKQMLLAGRNHGPRILVDALLDQRVPEDDLPVLVADAWTMAEYPTRCEEPHVWESLFRRIGYRNAAGDQIERPDKIVLYRGASVLELEEDSFGMSWTTSREQAQWFAERYGQDGMTVYRAEVAGDALLADYRDADRNESEIVVNPALLTHVEEDTMTDQPADLEPAQHTAEDSLIYITRAVSGLLDLAEDDIHGVYHLEHATDTDDLPEHLAEAVSAMETAARIIKAETAFHGLNRRRFYSNGTPTTGTYQEQGAEPQDDGTHRIVSHDVTFDRYPDGQQNHPLFRDVIKGTA